MRVDPFGQIAEVRRIDQSRHVDRRAALARQLVGERAQVERVQVEVEHRAVVFEREDAGVVHEGLGQLDHVGDGDQVAAGGGWLDLDQWTTTCLQRYGEGAQLLRPQLMVRVSPQLMHEILHCRCSAVALGCRQRLRRARRLGEQWLQARLACHDRGGARAERADGVQHGATDNSLINRNAERVESFRRFERGPERLVQREVASHAVSAGPRAPLH